MLTKVIQQIWKTQIRSFATSSSKAVSIQFKLISTRSFDQFFKVYEQHATEFDAEVFSSSYRVLLGLFKNDREGSLNSTEADQFMNSLFAINVESFTVQQIPNILGLIYTFGRKFSFGYLTNSKVEEILSRLPILLEENQELDSTFCCQAISEVSHFSYGGASFKILAERIIALTRDVKLSSFQMSLALNAINNTGVLSMHSRQLRNLILLELGSITKSLKLSELVQLCCDLNKFHDHTWSWSEKRIINDIFQTLLQSASELDERSVLSLVSVPTIENYPLFLVIEEINRNLINEFQSDGSCAIEKNFLLKILLFLNKHVRIFKDSDSGSRIFAVLKAKQEEADREGVASGLALTVALQKLISTRFFQYNQKDQLKKLFQGRMAYMNDQTYFSLANLEILLENDYVEFLESSHHSERYDKDAFNLATLILYLKKFPENAILQKHYARSTSIFQANFENEEKFTRAFSGSYNFKKTSKNSSLKVINEHFDQRMLKLLPCPFEGQFNMKAQLRYVLYVVYFLKRDSLYKQINRIKPLMSLQLKERMISYYAREKNLDSEKINWWLSFFLSNLEEFIVSGRQATFRDICKSLELVQISISKKEVQGAAVTKYYKVLRQIVLNQERISEFFKQVRYFLSTVLTTSMKKYNNEVEHRKIIYFCINRLSTFSNFKEIVIRILREGIRMNIIEPKHIEGLNMAEYQDNHTISKQLHILRGELSLEAIPKPFPVKTYDIEIILKSGDIEWILNHEQELISAIENNSRKSDLVVYLTSFAIPLTNEIAKSLLKMISNNFVQNVTTLDGIDVISMLSNFRKNRLSWNPDIKNVMKHVVQMVEKKYNSFNMNTHIEIVKLVSQTRNIDIQFYGEQLISRLNSKSQQQKSKIELYYNLACCGFSFQNVDLANICNFYSNESAIALETFLLLENILPAEEKKAILTKIIENIEKLESEEEDQEFSELNSHYYNYLLRHYPEETKNLDINKIKFKEAYPLTRPASDNFEAVLNALTKITGKTYQAVPIEGQSGQAYLIDGIHLVPIQYFKVNGKLSNNLIERIIIDKFGFPVVAAFNGTTKSEFGIINFLKNTLSLSDQQKESILKELKQDGNSEEEEA